MSHVDEGALHAYLDGALDDLPAVEAARIRDHLAGCAACAHRLEEERALRADAQAILAGAGPALGELPPLEELRALARMREGPSAGARLRRVAWAASIVMAVGTGWLLRGSQGYRFDRPAGAPPATSLEEMEASSPGSSPVVEVASEQAGPATDAAGVPAEPTLRRVTPVADPATTSVADAATTTVADPATNPVSGAPRFAAAEREATAGGAPATRLEAALAAQSGRGGALAALQDSLEARMGEARVRVAEEKSVEAAAPAPTVPAPTRAVSPLRTDVEPGFEMPRRRMVAQDLAGSFVRPAASGFAPLVVPGLPVISVTSGDPGLPDGAVRILQILEGDTLEVTHVPGGDQPPILPRGEDDDRVEVVLPSEGGWVVGRARVSRARLESLLAQVSGGR